MRSGEEVILTSFELPPEIEEVEVPELDNLITEAQKEELTSLSRDLKVKGPVDINVTALTKAGRCDIHKSISKVFKNLSTTTKEKDGEKFISVVRGNQPQRNKQWQFPGNHTHFTVHFENRGKIFK